jgi:hypothetical protein
MGAIRSRSDSNGITFDYYSVRWGKTLLGLEYGIVGMRLFSG